MGGHLPEALEDLGLGQGVHGGSGFVEHQDVGVFSHECTRQGDLLPLAQGQLLAALEPPPELRVVAVGQVFDDRARHALGGGALPPNGVVGVGDVAHADVRAHRELVLHEVLEDHPDSAAERFQVPLGKRPSVQRDRARVRCVQPRQQFDQRRLAAAVVPHQRQPRPRPQVERHVAQRGLLGVGIRVGHPLEPHAIARIRAVGGRPRRARHLLLQVLVQIAQVQVVLVHAADRLQDRRERRLTQCDPLQHRGQRHPRIRPVQRARRQQPEQKSPERPPQRQIPVVAVQPRETLPISRQQHRPQLKQLDLFGEVLPGDHDLQVELFSRLRGMPPEQPKRLSRELRLHHECRHRRHRQQQAGPRRELPQQHPVTRQRNRVLNRSERLVHERQRPPRGLPPRPRHLVVELRVLEMRQVQLQRLLQDHHVHAMAQLGPQQRRTHLETLLHRGHSDHQAGFDRHPEQRRVPIRNRPRVGRLQDPVHNPRAHDRDRRRHQPRQQRQDAHRHGQRATGLPDEPRRVRRVPKHVQKSGQLLPHAPVISRLNPSKNAFASASSPSA